MKTDSNIYYRSYYCYFTVIVIVTVAYEFYNSDSIYVIVMVLALYQ